MGIQQVAVIVDYVALQIISGTESGVAGIRYADEAHVRKVEIGEVILVAAADCGIKGGDAVCGEN